jgi:FMN-dependent NADH-azoreductase
LTLADFASSEAQAVLGEFLSTDVFIIGAPTDNFGISSQLESWFDHILVPGETFRYTENGVEGPATEKKAIVAVSRGNIYSAVGRTHWKNLPKVTFAPCWRSLDFRTPSS